MCTRISSRLVLIAATLILGSRVALASTAPTDSAALVAAVEEYHEGFRRGAPGRVSAVLGPSFTMFNGNFSGDPRTWEVHMYLTGPRLEEWPVNFLRQAGPYENQVRVVRVHVRGDAGLVVTEETGRNGSASGMGRSSRTCLDARAALAAGRILHP